MRDTRNIKSRDSVFKKYLYLNIEYRDDQTSEVGMNNVWSHCEHILHSSALTKSYKPEPVFF